MRRVAASAVVMAMTSTALIGLASPSMADTTSPAANPLPPILQVVQTAEQSVNGLMCELFENLLFCGLV